MRLDGRGRKGFFFFFFGQVMLKGRDVKERKQLRRSREQPASGPKMR